MVAYYLRIEGVNLSEFVYDTQDLSTVRGGGLMLLDAVDYIASKVTGAKLQPVTTGASSGIFRFDADGPDMAEAIRREAESVLHGSLQGETPAGGRRDYSLKHATFVVDRHPVSAGGEEGFVMDREALLARNRWGQMCQPSLAIPAQNRQRTLHCYIDLVRPGTEDMYTPEGERRKISASVETRREYGRAQKRYFYRSQAGSEALPDTFAQDFDELTHGPGRQNLHHKMAVVYLDGNGFGKLQDNKCTTPALQTKFDEAVREYRKALLRALFEELILRDVGGWRNPQTGDYQIETLLWGGDEVIWVVPAWQGWKTLRFFFEHTREKNWSFGDVPLTHKAGLVFCHHTAPISRVRRLAEELARLARKKIGNDGNEDVFAYQVLESFDHVGRDVEGFRTERVPWDGSPEQLVLSGKDMGDIERHMASLKPEFPRTKLHQIVHALVRKPDGKRREVDLARAAEIIEKLRLDDTTRAATFALTGYLGGEGTRWFHMADLWDYVGV